jgi:hypothetical protein
LVWNAFSVRRSNRTRNVQRTIQHTAHSMQRTPQNIASCAALSQAVRPSMLHAVVACCIVCCTLCSLLHTGPASATAGGSLTTRCRSARPSHAASGGPTGSLRTTSARAIVCTCVARRVVPNRVVRACSKQNCELLGCGARRAVRRNTVPLRIGCVLHGMSTVKTDGREQYTSRLLEYVPTTSSSTPSKSMSNSHAHITELKLRDRRTINSAQTVRSYSTCPPTRTLTQSHCCLWLCLRPLAGRDQPNQTKPHNPIRFAKA